MRAINLVVRLYFPDLDYGSLSIMGGLTQHIYLPLHKLAKSHQAST